MFWVHFSQARILKFGVLQGSILGLLLFLLYVNDLSWSFSNAGSYLYTDNTCIFYHYEDVKRTENVLIRNSLHCASSSETISCQFILEKIKLNPFSFQRREISGVVWNRQFWWIFLLVYFWISKSIHTNPTHFTLSPQTYT